MKFPARKLKFWSDSLVERPSRKIEDKSSKNFTPAQKASFGYLKNVSLDFTQNT